MNSLHTEVLWAAQHRWAAREHFGSMPQPFETLWLVCEGAVTVEIGRRNFVANARQILLMPAQLDRDISTASGALWWSLGWKMRLLDGQNPLEKLPLPLIFAPSDAIFQTLCGAAQSLACEWGGGQSVVVTSRDLAAGKVGFWPVQFAGNDALVWNGLENLLAGWFWRAAQNAGFEAPLPRAFPQCVEKTLREMRENPAASVADFAGQAGFSVSRFRALFAQEIGLAPHEFLTRIRLERARLWLETSQKSVEAIALEIGFDSPSHFARRFAAQFGQTPQRYRQNHAVAARKSLV